MRNKPLLTMLEAIRVIMIEGMNTMRKIFATWTDDICLSILKRIDLMKNHTIDSFKVRSGSDASKVDFATRTCSCRMWQISRLPCEHAMQFSKSIRCQKRRQRKKRIRESHEDGSGTKVSKAKKADAPDVGRFANLLGGSANPLGGSANPLGRSALGVGRSATGVGRSGVGRSATGVGRSGVGRSATGVGRSGVGKPGVGRSAIGMGRNTTAVGRFGSGVGVNATGLGRSTTLIDDEGMNESTNQHDDGIDVRGSANVFDQSFG
uniref:Multidrug resistance-associated protein 5 n=1 Tax=Tanacetum cinerariifolium TaxID=118510 RepID=A0A699HI71_TANCI|nr:multidrug resistance-associated protein 5 [Tanacetum cinerariifolium]